MSPREKMKDNKIRVPIALHAICRQLSAAYKAHEGQGGIAITITVEVNGQPKSVITENFESLLKIAA